MNRFVFSTSFMPEGMNDRARLARWQETMREMVAGLDLVFEPDKPLSVHFEHAPLGSVALGRFKGSLAVSTRTKQHINADQRDDFLLCFYRGDTAEMSQSNRTAKVAANIPLFNSNGMPYKTHHRDCSWDGLILSRAKLAEAISQPDDLVLRPMDGNPEALQYLDRYLGWLNDPKTVITDPHVIAHVERTLLDLVTLALGASRDHTELASMRGLRAARVQDVLSQIASRFADPALSPDEVARRMGVSARYVQDLLQHTGRSFAERVLELRLQKARAMLGNRACDRLKVSDIALSCGFNEVSYFNRCFRRRFGCSPTQYRGGNGGNP